MHSFRKKKLITNPQKYKLNWFIGNFERCESWYSSGACWRRWRPGDPVLWRAVTAVCPAAATDLPAAGARSALTRGGCGLSGSRSRHPWKLITTVMMTPVSILPIWYLLSLSLSPFLFLLSLWLMDGVDVIFFHLECGGFLLSDLTSIRVNSDEWL